VSFTHDWPLAAWPTLGEVNEAIAIVVTRMGTSMPEVIHQPWHAAASDTDDQDEERNELGEIDGFGVTDPQHVLPTDTTITLLFNCRVKDALAVILRLAPDCEVRPNELEPPRVRYDMAAAARDGVLREAASTGLAPDLREYATWPLHYTVALELVAPFREAPDLDEEPPCLRVDSNLCDNPQAFPLVAVVGEALERELAIVLARS
jgi:hypothetical protein